MARAILEPQPVTLPEEARPTLERFVELRCAGARRQGDRARAEGRRRRPEGTAARADRRRAGARALDGDRRAAAGRGAAAGRCGSIAPSTASSSICPSHRARSACTSAARPSTRGRTSATRGRSSSLSWFARWLRARGYEVTLVHNITDVNDKIYEAAPGASAERAEEATEWYLEDTGRFGLDEVDHWPKVTETMDEIVAFIADLVERGFAYEVDGDVYFRVSRWAGVRPPLRAAARSGRGAGAEPAQGGSARLRALEGQQAGRGHVVGLALGPRPARAGTSSARRWRRQLLGPGFEIHGGGLDLVFPHHENELAQSRARGHEFAQDLDAQRDASLHRREDVEVARQRRDDRGGARRAGGRETTLVFFLTAHWRSPIDFSDERMAAARPRAERPARGLPEPVRAGRRPDAWERFEAALDDDFDTPEALALMHEWRDHDLLRRGARRLRPGGPRRAGGGAARGARAGRRARQEARAAKDFARPTSCATEIEAAGWDVRDDPGGYRLVPKR